MGYYLPLAYLPELVTSIPQEHQDGSHHYITSGEAALLLSLVNAGNLTVITWLRYFTITKAKLASALSPALFGLGFFLIRIAGLVHLSE